MGIAAAEDRGPLGACAQAGRADGGGVDLLEYMVSVRHIARQVHRKLPSHIELDDLISAGTLGLMDAFRRFDESRHIQFKSFAQFRIRGAILDWLRMLDWSPRELRRKRRVADAAAGLLTQRLGRTPSETEIAAELKMDLTEFQDLLSDLNGLRLESLNEPLTDSAAEELDLLPGPCGNDPLSHVLESEQRRRLEDAMESLPERQRLVLTLYYYEELTLKEIGAMLGVVESRVSQIRAAAIARLRSAMGVASREVTAMPSAPARTASLLESIMREAA